MEGKIRDALFLDKGFRNVCSTSEALYNNDMQRTMSVSKTKYVFS